MTNPNGAVAASREWNVVRAWRVDPFYFRTVKGTENSTAIVNGKIVREGDRLNAFVVTRITENAVILKDETGNLVRVTFSRQGG